MKRGIIESIKSGPKKKSAIDFIKIKVITDGPDGTENVITVVWRTAGMMKRRLKR